MKYLYKIGVLLSILSISCCFAQTTNSTDTESSLSQNEVANSLAQSYLGAQVHQVRQTCSTYVYRSNVEFQIFIQKIKDSLSAQETKDILIQEVDNKQKLFSYKQLMEVFTVLRYHNEKLVTIKIFKKQLSYLTVNELLTLLETINYTNLEFINQFLKALTISYSEVLKSLDEVRQTEIVERFSEIAYIGEASVLIDEFKADCETYIDGEYPAYTEEYSDIGQSSQEDFQNDVRLFGDAENEVAVLFMIDVTYSMNTIMTKNNRTESRLDFVKYELSETLDNLKPEAMFNIMTFDEQTHHFKVTSQRATPDNISEAKLWLQAVSTDNSSTDIEYALEKAFFQDSTHTLRSIYLLSDKINSVSGSFSLFITRLNEGRDPKIIINTIKFSTFDSPQLQAIAQGTNGLYRNYQIFEIIDAEKDFNDGEEIAFDGEIYTEEDFQNDDDLFGGAQYDKSPIFIIENSFNMQHSYTYLKKQGHINKIDFVKTELIKTLNKLKPEAMFNILTYNSGTQQYKPTSQNATAENISAAIDWVNSMMFMGYNFDQDLKGALEDTFFQDSNDLIRSAYVFSDDTSSDISNIPTFISGLNKDRKPKVRINTIIIDSNGNGSQQLYEIAHCSYGYYKNYK